MTPDYLLSVDIAMLVPHQGPMCLLDGVVNVDSDEIVAQVTPRRDDLLAEAEGVHVHAALEWMAQAAAAWSTLNPGEGDEGPREGMLLGARRFTAHCDWLPFDRALQVRVRLEVLADSGLGRFIGSLHDGETHQPLAEADLSVLQTPPTPRADTADTGHQEDAP
ncbi:ApeP family dehydratase [Kushneria aurantia]|uniref:3-hydroxylacyl-ACP dehydratase n=1 Tax=Kushneria aurantia TaxID=504092 RepID=A0ABV6FZM0_9GAMM|nr:hypothetical protein [Kushneria aurantia]